MRSKRFWYWNLREENKELRDQSMGTYQALDYNYDKCTQAKGFKLFLRTIQPRFDSPSSFTIMRDCLKIYVEEKILQIALRGQQLCLTTYTLISF
uniref:Uncharacterized protein n=1 Tax=Salix viminalis TaxID=40686 RepID=A0A6N2LHS2_SALVM